MALISNGVRLAQGNAYYSGGNAATSAAYTAERAVMWSPGSRRRFAYGEGSITGTTDHSAVPEGYLPPSCFDMPQKSGGMASKNRVVGTGNISNGNLAGGLNGESAITGTGGLTAALALILSAVANIVGTGDLSADVIGKLEAAAIIAGNSNVTGALGAIAGLLASLQGDGDLTSDIIAKASIEAGIVVTGELLNTANVGNAVFAAISEAGFSYGDTMRILAAIAVGKTNIVDNGGGNADVTFRDINDTKDRVVAELQGSERINVVLDGE